ncbi:MAG: hypothetical protein MUP60_03960, partial [Candidatus Thorarchaeota archaeon]|nr:hypothetical protein [Candidatus Thorarchaeota archaeon]
MTEMKKVSEMEPDEIKEEVRKAYSKVAEGTAVGDIATGCCDEPTQKQSSCCGPAPEAPEPKVLRVNIAEALGYDTEG